MTSFYAEICGYEFIPTSSCLILTPLYLLSSKKLFDNWSIILFQTLLNDINNLTNDGHRWTQEDKFMLESQLLLHTNEPLCLDPSPEVFYVATQLHNRKHVFNTKALKRLVI